jgi:hypothetical protein
VDKMIACAKEAASGVELPAEILDQTRSAAEQGCSAWSAMGDALTKAMDSCKDKPCAEWGACVAQAITAAATAAVPTP